MLNLQSEFALDVNSSITLVVALLTFLAYKKGAYQKLDILRLYKDAIVG